VRRQSRLQLGRLGFQPAIGSAVNPRIQRGAIAAVQVLALAVWFSVSAVVPSLRQEWGISSTAAVWLTGSVQLGFVVGAVGSAALNLPDRIRPHLMLAASAAAAALCTLLFALVVSNMAGAIALRFLTGVFLAGVYPVGIKLMASWSASSARGRAVGILVAALTLGSALPHLIGGIADLPWRAVLFAAAGIGLLGSLMAVALVRPGPYLSASAHIRYPQYALTMFRERGPRLANLGYFGHMWELYALWTWLPAFLLAAPSEAELPASAEITMFLAMGVAGVIGCLLGGWGADRFGRPPAAVAALALSGLCCLLSPLAFRANPTFLFIFCAIWGAAVIADSGVFSTLLSEEADTRFVGTALTAQTAIGFGITTVSIQLVPVLAETTGWQYGFLLLAPGPVLGVLAMSSISRRPTAATTEPA
jgi:MFS family permease